MNWQKVIACGVIGLGSAVVVSACAVSGEEGEEMGAGDASAVDETGTAEEALRPFGFCGGIAGFPCPDGYTCVDDPRDTCDPRRGGADCGGMCIPRRGPPPDDGDQCSYDDPTRRYLARNPDRCAVMRFVCNEGEEAFFDDCGCGCQGVGETCGDSVCGAGEYCCNESCGICAPMDGFCTQQVCTEPIATER